MSGDDGGPSDRPEDGRRRETETGSDTAEDPPATGEPTESEESYLLTYAAPFLGVLLIASGIPIALVGGYVVMQDTLGLCGDPDIEIRTLEDGERPASTVGDLEYDELSETEQRALREAIDSPLEEATVDGEGLENEAALLEGVVIEVDGQEYYVRIASLNSCLEAEPLLFPIGSVAILVGIAGVLTPPIYRKMAGFEERIQRDRRR
ncbi:hypothetical protein [Natronorubrum texcoconense]|uniref:DUF7979 domain-containing protein n=1 Tax=Natronorubrum texcoconense TaxID=1095776 RepID=A0A1G9EEX6_9EURY|nr:hypothetical protein [Natronorubrum texcoconense]SDK74611.1 hypothetical protein SAMN04515672_3888 [Natronorubrum texcoconense]